MEETLPYGFPTRRVVMAAIKHESHTFNRFPTPLALFQRQGYHRDEAAMRAFRATGLEMADFIAVAEPVAVKVVSCDAGGLTTYDYSRLPFRNIRDRSGHWMN